jgi:hypothetical protein
MCLHATCIIVCFVKKEAVIPCAGASSSKALGALDGTFQHCACMQRVLLFVLKRKLLFPVQVRATAKRWAPWTARFNTVLACNVYYCLF